MVKLNIQWAAGFFEGEGYVGCKKTRNHRGVHKYKRLSMSVAQINKAPLDAFCDILKLGVVRGPYGPYHTTKQPYYQWLLHGEDVIKACDKLSPYMFEKSIKARNAVSEYLDWKNNKNDV